MKKYSTKEIVKILEDRIEILQGQLNRNIPNNTDANRRHWKKEVAKARKQIAQLNK